MNIVNDKQAVGLQVSNVAIVGRSCGIGVNNIALWVNIVGLWVELWDCLYGLDQITY